MNGLILRAVRIFRNRVTINCNREREVTLLVILARYELFLELFNDHVFFLNLIMKLSVTIRWGMHGVCDGIRMV